jgi:hypothetical protein
MNRFCGILITITEVAILAAGACLMVVASSLAL